MGQCSGLLREVTVTTLTLAEKVAGRKSMSTTTTHSSVHEHHYYREPSLDSIETARLLGKQNKVAKQEVFTVLQENHMCCLT